jgi:membrane fusion protein, copper/silver efflux system
VNPGENLYRIADLSRVWVQAEVFEQEAPLLRPGLEAEIRLPYSPGRSYRGRVDYIYPYLESATRTIRVRLVVPNPDFALRPEMYANVRFTIPQMEDHLVVPNEAILDTGERKIAFVSLGDGVFEPRELKTGLRTREYTVVLEGLEEGEPVVVSGNFLIDSESRLKAALAGMGAAGVHQH